MPPKGKIISFKKETAKKDVPNDILDSGVLGDLSFEIHGRWNTIHITDKKAPGKIFKKDCDKFQDEFDAMNFDDLVEKQVFTIEGSGDNANLVFTKKDGEILISLEPKKYQGIQKFKDLLLKSKEKVMNIKPKATKG